jgi:hypothetical protein
MATVYFVAGTRVRKNGLKMTSPHLEGRVTHRGPSRDRTSNAVLAGPEGGRPQSNGAAVVFPLVGGSTHTKQR